MGLLKSKLELELELEAGLLSEGLVLSILGGDGYHTPSLHLHSVLVGGDEEALEPILIDLSDRFGTFFGSRAKTGRRRGRVGMNSNSQDELLSEELVLLPEELILMILGGDCVPTSVRLSSESSVDVGCRAGLLMV